MISTFGTLGALAIFLVIGFLPRVPWWGKLVAQLLLGGVIYFGFSQSFFELPFGDTLPISALAGGDGGMGEFSPLSFGVIGTVLGFLATAVGTAIGALVEKRRSS